MLEWTIEMAYENDDLNLSELTESCQRIEFYQEICKKHAKEIWMSSYKEPRRNLHCYVDVKN